MGSSTKASRTSQTMGVSSRTRDWAMRNCKRLFVVRTWQQCWRHMQGCNQELYSRKPLSIERALSWSLATVGRTPLSLPWSSGGSSAHPQEQAAAAALPGSSLVMADLPPTPSGWPVLLSQECCLVSSLNPGSELFAAWGPWCPDQADGKFCVKGMFVPLFWAWGLRFGLTGRGDMHTDGQVGRMWLFIVS